ncbi:MAG: glycosyltransferase [Sporolactobacillus sp.]
MKNIHVLVASSTWTQDGLRYRRHRFADYLRAQPETEAVIWLCPSSEQSAETFITLDNGIRQWTIADWLPFKAARFSRFIDNFYQTKVDYFLEQLHHMNGRFYLWYTFPGFPLLADLFPWESVIYDCSDLWSAPISGRLSLAAQLRRLVIGRAETRIINCAEHIFCTSDYLHDHVLQQLQEPHAPSVVTLENGVDYAQFNRAKHWTKPVLPVGFSGKVIGYIGGIKPKLDFRLVGKAAQQRPDWLFLFIGPDHTRGAAAFQQLLNLPNVRWIGAIAADEVPDYMRLIDLGMMPYKASPYNSAVFPLKLFEFLAAGKPAVGVCLPATKRYAQAGLYTCLSHSEAEAFVAECQQLLETSADPQLIASRKLAARRKDWAERFEQMTHFMKEKGQTQLAEIFH